MNRKREVVVTGIGIVSPIGIGRENYWTSLVEGRSGVAVREPFTAKDNPLRIAAEVRDFEAKKYVKPRKALKIMCGPIQFGCAAAAMAVEDAKLDREAIDANRLATVFGTETFYADPAEVADVFRKCTDNKNYQHERWGEFAMREIQPLWMLKYLPNMAASHISIALDARGPSNSICQGEASGLLALVEGADLIQRGLADIVVAGGTGSQMSLTAMLYRGVSMLSKRLDEPEKASRPFDKNRDGMVVGEGAAALILESAESAQTRNVKPLAKLAGWARNYLSPQSAAFEDAIQANFELAIENSQIGNSDIGCINANATGSIIDDRVEAKAIEKLFNDTPVVAHKSNFGNVGPGTSMLELAGGILALESGQLPPSINCDQTSDCQINVNRVLTKFDEKQALLKSSFSSTGQICSVVMEPR